MYLLQKHERRIVANVQGFVPAGQRKHTTRIAHSVCATYAGWASSTELNEPNVLCVRSQAAGNIGVDVLPPDSRWKSPRPPSLRGLQYRGPPVRQATIGHTVLRISTSLIMLVHTHPSVAESICASFRSSMCVVQTLEALRTEGNAFAHRPRTRDVSPVLRNLPPTPTL